MTITRNGMLLWPFSFAYRSYSRVRCDLRHGVVQELKRRAAALPLPMYVRGQSYPEKFTDLGAAPKVEVTVR
jgi:hypothetical protein